MHLASLIGIGLSVALVILACYLKYYWSKQAKRKSTNNQNPAIPTAVDSRQTAVYQQPAYPTPAHPSDLENSRLFSLYNLSQAEYQNFKYGRISDNI